MGNAADPALTAHGVTQSQELATHLMSVEPCIERVYSSPYYRCLQTIEPFVKQYEVAKRGDADQVSTSNPNRVRPQSLPILPVDGLSEWFGVADFEQPTAAPKAHLSKIFPDLDASYVSKTAVPRHGESLADFHDRVALTMQEIVHDCDTRGLRAAVLCTHAAVLIAIGRILTGSRPADLTSQDFKAFTCGLSVYRRKHTQHDSGSAEDVSPTQLGGKWACESDGDCSFLAGGAERGWSFSDEEAFLRTNPDKLDNEHKTQKDFKL